jgi:hypothetical protein
VREPTPLRTEHRTRTAQPQDAELREFRHVVRRALLMLAKWIEVKYPNV